MDPTDRRMEPKSAGSHQGFTWRNHQLQLHLYQRIRWTWWERAAKTKMRRMHQISTLDLASDELDKSDKDKDEVDTSNLYVESRVLNKWANYDDKTSNAYSWLSVLSLVDYAASPKRAGERRQFQLSTLTNRVKRYDFLGIPSSALLLAAANSLHDNIVAPHKQEIVDFVKGIFTALWGILEFR